MKFYFTDRINGTPRELTMDEVHQYLSEGQIREAIEEGDREAIIDWLENTAPAFWENNPYRRIAPLLGALKGIEPTQWDELHIVHYGY